MSIRVTLTLILPEFWGADDAWECGGPAAVKDLIYEDVLAFIDDVNEANWKIEKVE